MDIPERNYSLLMLCHSRLLNADLYSILKPASLVWCLWSDLNVKPWPPDTGRVILRPPEDPHTLVFSPAKAR